MNRILGETCVSIVAWDAVLAVISRVAVIVNAALAIIMSRWMGGCCVNNVQALAKTKHAARLMGRALLVVRIAGQD